MGRFLIRVLLAGAVLLATDAVAQAPSAMRIQYAEPVALKPSPGAMSFDAYGRRFDLELRNNERVTAKLPAQRKVDLARYHLYRGTLAGQARSWVRLTEFSGRVEGAIWDGQDLYAVTTLDRVAPSLTTPIHGNQNQTVVYRLSDTINALPRNFCAVDPAVPKDKANNGLVQYRALVAELAARATALNPVPLQIDISIIGDATFQGKFGADAIGELLARHNVADGVFAEQVGLLIVPEDLRLAPTAPDPFTSVDAEALLNQLSTFRKANGTVAALGLAHLFTGRDITGDTVGIAFIGGACDIDQGVSLTESSLGSTIDGLIMAHELGHNFGAVHDGQGACAAVPPDYLMSPSFNFSATFSQCSLDTMRPVIQGASCIKPASYGDVALSPAAATLNVENDVPLTVPYVVSSIGTQTARNASLTVTAPQDFTITAATGGNCSVAPDAVTCQLGDIPAGEDRTVSVTLLPSHVGNYVIDALVSADNNPSRHNDTQLQPVTVALNADARIAMTASAQTLFVGDPLDVSIVVQSTRSHAAQGVTVQLWNPRVQFDSVTLAGGTCQFNAFQTTCTLDDIAGGSTRTITLHGTAVSVGTAELAANLNASVDADPDNNSARLNLTFKPLRDVGIEEVTPNIVSFFDQPFQFTANVHSTGPQSIDNVFLNLTILTPQFGDHGIESVTVGGATCTSPMANDSYTCPLGSLAGGEIRPVVISGHGTSLGTYEILMRVVGTGDQDSYNDELDRGVTIKNGIDVGVVSPPPVFLVEGLEGYSSVSGTSYGSLAVPVATLDLVAPDALRFTHVYLPAAQGDCSILTDQHVQCTVSFPANNPGGGASLTFFLVGAVAGSYQLTATMSAPNDELHSNDSLAIPVTVSPIVDVGVQDFTGPQFLNVGDEFTVNTNVVVGSRPVPGASAYVLAQGGGAEISSMTTGAGVCTRTDAGRFDCDFGPLAAGASVPLSVVVHGAQAISQASLSINASAVGDNNPNDDTRSIMFRVSDPGDVQVSAGSGITATAGTPFMVPITLSHTGPLVAGHLEISLPTGVTLGSIAAGILICTGTSTLECDLNSWPEDQAFQIDLTLNAAMAGSYTVSATVSSANDNNASNNQGSVAITVNAVPVQPPANPPPASKPSGGGGGRFDPALLAALGLLLALSSRRRLSLVPRDRHPAVRQ